MCHIKPIQACHLVHAGVKQKNNYRGAENKMEINYIYYTNINININIAILYIFYNIHMQ
jgi:hypothetical protein